MSFVLQPEVIGKVSFAHATDASVFATAAPHDDDDNEEEPSSAAASSSSVVVAPSAYIRNFQLAIDETTTELVDAEELAPLDVSGLKTRLVQLCADNFLPRALRDVGVSTSFGATPPDIPPHSTVGPSSSTHNIITVTDGVLIVCVAFGTGGDDDQFLGVLQAPAPDDASYSHLDHGWCVSSNRPAMAKRTRADHQRWKLKGFTVTMLVDVARASVSFWSAGAHATMRTGLPPNTPLTAAVGLYHNTATVTAMRLVPSASPDPLLAGVRGGTSPAATSAASGGGGGSSAAGGHFNIDQFEEMFGEGGLPPELAEAMHHGMAGGGAGMLFEGSEEEEDDDSDEE